MSEGTVLSNFDGLVEFFANYRPEEDVASYVAVNYRHTSDAVKLLCTLLSDHDLHKVICGSITKIFKAGLSHIPDRVNILLGIYKDRFGVALKIYLCMAPQQPLEPNTVIVPISIDVIFNRFQTMYESSEEADLIQIKSLCKLFNKEELKFILVSVITTILNTNGCDCITQRVQDLTEIYKEQFGEIVPIRIELTG
jgi:hypothetical protein